MISLGYCGSPSDKPAAAGLKLTATTCRHRRLALPLAPLLAPAWTRPPEPEPRLALQPSAPPVLALALPPALQPSEPQVPVSPRPSALPAPLLALRPWALQALALLPALRPSALPVLGSPRPSAPQARQPAPLPLALLAQARIRCRSWRLRQRVRAVGLGAQEGDHLGALVGVGQAREGHHRARSELGRLVDQPVDMRVVPHLLGMGLHRRGVVEAFDRCDLAPQYAVEIGADRAWRALLESMACLADGGVPLTLGWDLLWPRARQPRD